MKNHPERDLWPTIETVEEVSDTQQIPPPDPAKDEPVKRLEEALAQTRDERLQKAKVGIDIFLIQPYKSARPQLPSHSFP